MAKIGSSSFESSSERGLIGWVVHQLSALRDQMRADIVSSDERMKTAIDRAEQKMHEAQQVLRSSKDH